MFMQDFFMTKPRKKGDVAKKLKISRQAVSYSAGKAHRLPTKVLYRFMLNAKSDFVDFLLNDENFDNKDIIKWENVTMLQRKH